ncbi:glycoside hydrolase, partial [Aureobasidium pullulans]
MITTTLATHRGFNYAAQGNDYESFYDQFTLSKTLPGTGSFSSARLYTMLQEDTNGEVISAIPAALATGTSILLGLWASVDQDQFSKEINALIVAMAQYGPGGLSGSVVGISVGSEDLYRASALGAASNAGTGQNISVLLDYIGQVRSVLKGSVLKDVPVGHVDTLDAYENDSNGAILDAVDFIGLNIFPYFSKELENDISQAANSFWQAYDSMLYRANGKAVWITETGWATRDPSKVNGPSPGIENAANYWSQVACGLAARCIDFWWYILSDPADMPFFGVTDADAGHA